MENKSIKMENEEEKSEFPNIGRQNANIRSKRRPSGRPLAGAGKNVAKKSGQGLDFYRWIVVYFTLLSRCVGIGRRDRLKICCPQGRVGSSPTTGTKKEAPVRGFFFCGEPWDLKRSRRGQSRSGEVFTRRAGRLLQRAPAVTLGKLLIGSVLYQPSIVPSLSSSSE